VTSNCVINLVPDKAVVFREIARVLKPGGRLVISDVLLSGKLPRVVEESLLAWAGCVSGALPRERYFALLGAAGLTDVEVLKDMDFVEKLGGELPKDVAEILAEAGLSAADVAGKVRSVTYRAVRAA
jgi:SAM-dependent methyltransferase